MRCIIASCGMDMHKRKELCGISSHRLPKNPKKRLAWLKVLDPSGTQYSIVSDARVCSRHFQESDFYDAGGKRKLTKGAVPSLNLGSAAELPPAVIPSDSHYVFLEEPELACNYHDEANVPVTLHSTAIAAMNGARSSSGKTKTIRYAGDLTAKDLAFISPKEAKKALPKVYKQLQRTKMRVNSYKQQNMRLRKKVDQLIAIITDLRDQYEEPVPRRKRKIKVNQQEEQESSFALEIEPTELCERFVQETLETTDAAENLKSFL